MGSAVFLGVEIPEALLAEETQHHAGPNVRAAREAAGRALAAKALLLRRARELGLEAEPEVDEYGREETEDAALVRQLLEREIGPATPSDAECLAFYEDRPDRWRTPALYEASHILIQDGEGARDQAMEIIAALKRSPGRFAELAEHYSACPSARVGGSLGQNRRGDLAREVETALDLLSEGEISPEPAASRFGFHVLRLDRRLPGEIPPFAHVRERVRQALEARAWMIEARALALRLADEGLKAGPTLKLGDDGEVRRTAPLFGEFLREDASAARLEAWLARQNPELLARLLDLARAEGADLAAIVRSEVASFVSRASDEDWTKVISSARDAEDPGLGALTALLRDKIAPPPKTARTLFTRNRSKAPSH
jgi:peptidyl-prolyl cis-trans isomerase C